MMLRAPAGVRREKVASTDPPALRAIRSSWSPRISARAGLMSNAFDRPPIRTPMRGWGRGSILAAKVE